MEKTYNYREYLHILKENGFVFDHQTRGHLIFKRGNETIVTNRFPNKMVVRKMIKEYNLKV